MPVQILTASQIITFDDKADDPGVLLLEVDGRPNGLNGGKTDFMPGDSVGLLLYMSPNVSLIEMVVTYGTLASEGSATTDHTGFLAYAGQNMQSMSHPICSPAVSWIGNNLGGIDVVNCVGLKLTSPPDWNPGAPGWSAAGNIGVLRYAGSANAQSYRLTNTLIPGEPVPYQIAIYAFGLQTPTP